MNSLLNLAIIGGIAYLIIYLANEKGIRLETIGSYIVPGGSFDSVIDQKLNKNGQ